jgi:hypothetical protein
MTRICDVEECSRKAEITGLCRLHYYRKRRTGDVGPPKPLRNRSPNQGRYINNYGYVCLTTDRPAYAEKKKYVREHVVVMEAHLGRRLLPHENVHHKNGVRHDNRLENLELWSRSQPPRQRIEDKLMWAKDLLLTYESKEDLLEWLLSMRTGSAPD